MPKLSDLGLLRATFGYLKDPKVRLWRKLLGLAAVAYVVWPLDVIPDVVPVIGWLDDLGVLSLVAWFLVREVRRHGAQAPSGSPAAQATA